jgi:acetyltransferase-like isoleucine patch superfamily enzyme
MEPLRRLRRAIGPRRAAEKPPPLTLTLPDRLASYPANTRIGEENKFLHRVTLGGRGRFDSHLDIGSYCDLEGFWFFADRGGSLSIGSRSELNARSTFDILERIEIGDDVLLGQEIHVTDNDAHSLDWNNRRHDHMARRRGQRDWSVVARAPVRIESKCWIGRRVSILKGVVIGEGAVVAEGSVVTRSVEPWTLAAGVPAREIRSLPQPGEDEGAQAP